MSSNIQILKERGLERASCGYLSTCNNTNFVSYSLNTFHSHLLSELFLKSVYSFSITHFLGCSKYFKFFVLIVISYQNLVFPLAAYVGVVNFGSKNLTQRPLQTQNTE